MINRIVTNVTGSYCFSKKSHSTSSLLQRVLKMSDSSMNTSFTLTPPANSTFNDRATQSGPTTVNVSF